MKNLVIFCQSYTQIKIALHLITANYENQAITLVVPGNHNLFKFFKLINKKFFKDAINIVFFETYKIRVDWVKSKIKGILSVPPYIVRQRQYLKAIYVRHFAGLSGSQVYFSSRHFADYAYYLLNKLSKKNQLVYIPTPTADILSINKHAPINVLDLAVLGVKKAVFGWDLAMGRYLGRRVTCIPDEFMEKAVNKTISREERDEMLKDFDFSRFPVFNADNYDVLYFAHNIRLIKVSADTLKSELAGVFNILTKYFPEKRIAIKYHPTQENDKTMISTGVIIEDFIPAEFMYNEKVKMYLSPYSTALTNVGKGLAVSLIDLISCRDDELRKQAKESLKQRSRSEILFPQSLDEFEKIVAGLIQKGGASENKQNATINTLS